MGLPTSAQVDKVVPGKARIDRAKLAMTLSIGVIVGAMLWAAQRFPDRVALFPTVITSIVLLLALADLVRILRPGRFGPAEVSEEQVVSGQGDRRTSGAAAIGWLLLLVTATVLVGFLITVPLHDAVPAPARPGVLAGDGRVGGQRLAGDLPGVRRAAEPPGLPGLAAVSLAAWPPR